MHKPLPFKFTIQIPTCMAIFSHLGIVDSLRVPRTADKFLHHKKQNMVIVIVHTTRASKFILTSLIGEEVKHDGLVE